MLTLFKAALVLLAIVGVAAAVYALRKPTPEQRLAAFIETQKRAGHTIFQTSLQGKNVTLMLMDCKVYTLHATDRDVEKTEVLRTGFLLWFSGCISHSIERQGGYLMVELVNREFGAGGGNASGGLYRSLDAVRWEKQMRKGWLPVEEAQK